MNFQYLSAAESRTYNSLGQLIQLNNASVNMAYYYPSGANNGKISSQYNGVSGETIAYQYDSLKRLIAASGNGWNENFGYDPFGNLISKSGTDIPQLSCAANTSTNQSVCETYDANGNALGVSTGVGPLGYDARKTIYRCSIPMRRSSNTLMTLRAKESGMLPWMVVGT